MTAAFLAGVVAGYGIAVPVGAVAVLVMSLAARNSLTVGAAAALGVATADGLYAAAAAVVGTAVAGLVAPVAEPLRWCAGAVLVALAVHTALTAVRSFRVPDRTARPRQGLGTPRRAYLGLLALTLLNPLTVVYFAALVLSRQGDAALDAAGQGAFVVGAFSASASWQLLVAGGGSLVGRLLTGRRGRLTTALVSSAIILVLALAVLLR